MAQNDDYDPKFEAELEKAKALSMETLALEQFKQKRRLAAAGVTSTASSATNNGSSIDDVTLRKYKQELERRLGRPLSGGSVETWKQHQQNASVSGNNTNNTTRRVSEITPPPSRDVPDLMDFNAPSPTKPKDPQSEAHDNFKQLVQDMHKLNSQLQDVRNVATMMTPHSYAPQIPTPAAASLPLIRPPAYGFQAPSMLPSQMQIVPYSPPQVAQLYPQLSQVQPQSQDTKKPLTAEELQRLYSLNHAVVPRPNVVPAFMPQMPSVASNTTVPVGAYGTYGYGHPQYSLYKGTPVPPASVPYQNIYPTIGTVQAPELPPRTSLTSQSNYSQTAPSIPPRGSSPSIASLRDFNCEQKTRNLKIREWRFNRFEYGADDSRVSVLEAFDPLFIGERSSSDDDKESVQSSYYSEYDPFDYIYSGGTQYSDPVYDAVNRADKTPVSPSSGGSVSRPVGWYLPSTSDRVTPSNSESPPPLPPRITPTEEENLSANFRRTTKLYQDVCVKRTYSREMLAFYEMVKELRSHYRYDDETTNIGHVQAAQFSSQFAEGTSIKLLVYPELSALHSFTSGNVRASDIQGALTGYAPPIAFTCDINSSVEHVMMHVVCELEGQINGTVSDYMLKTIGAQEWLSMETSLSQLECVHNCIKLEKDVELGLCRKSAKLLKVIARTQQDDIRDAEITIENILPKEPSTSISHDELLILLETLETEIDKLESAASDSSTRVLSCSGVVQAVKAICALLGSIDTMKISTAINDLKTTCDMGQKKMPDIRTGAGIEVIIEKGDYAKVALRPKTTNEIMQKNCDKLRDAVRNLLDIYTHAFHVNFSVNTNSIAPRTKQMSILHIYKPVLVHINFLHRIPPTWKYDDYILGAQIYHGARYLGHPVVTQCNNNEEISGIYPRLKFDSWLMFEQISVCTLPREARLIFVLYGCVNEPVDPQDPNAKNQTTEGRITKIELGWTAVQFFDFERKMIEGDLLLSLWPPTGDKYFCPAPAKGTHPLGTYYPVLGIQVADYGATLLYPEPRVDIPTAPCLDFNSLDINLQQELIDTAEQGYPLDKLDKREVLWEKRYYLHKLPHALPKILHAAYSWDYNSVSDLHALLTSWTPLEPLQALELMLPRYPDLEVRKAAVKWFSKISNDQLVDFLPQLLQALKHDTYEASPLARFLLSRALESPRVAHYLYWLLAHSLPGEAPQNENSLDATVDDSVVIQARYHRRYRLMLRALLATCGEKLSTRFLYQNMICKILSDIAQSVKLAKESHRLSLLRTEVEKVNQLLQEHTTSLPLGPGLEVTGVRSQNCSYFNSNTLPLKIYFTGPDPGLLPAIFKCGDDLQQDMLTLQIVRIMDKLWLAEGLDLKMVTFDCVPTGDKKGMIEMVSDAETLRKIQVEWGLTGSFKDKPIAEWLAKQNPSQLEYQRAVTNFTSSCAGYSVATYILGICDRHNDNIMLKTSGHLFHIDFGKFLGDAQMFGNFKRDRTPFVLTSDMAYVINGGDRPSDKFHYFVDLCCKAFNIVRKHGDLLLHMFALMATSGIPGVTTEAVTYVRNALLPGQSNPEAAASFAKMIHISLKSWFTQFNFFLHNLAQMRFTNDGDGGELLSFIPKVYTMSQDGRLKSVMVHGYQKRYDLEKYYVYILRVTRQNQPDPGYLFRSWKEFCEFHQKLCIHFPLTRFHR
uniref:phosphatidylinositol 3-kinase n=1 Tax=Culicoides sonorensis TaxID=179676 RepID=A0A336MPB8_CULSO